VFLKSIFGVLTRIKVTLSKLQFYTYASYARPFIIINDKVCSQQTARGSGTFMVCGDIRSVRYVYVSKHDPCCMGKEGL